ncbi:NAD(P)-dependent oxidoreductase [Amycolatopsis sp. lyj-112]|uniref:NAD(P)-dependent oxidoreductase n=1 Tax=Amycolatopsis sp. lyj-112 TaxID=2789288 RepID=UPI00397B9FC7
MTATFSQISVMPGVWPTTELLERLRAMSERSPLVLSEWPSADSVDRRAFVGTDAILAGWKDELGAERLAQLPALRYIGLRATSTDRVDLDYTTSHGVTVSPIQGYGDIGTMEFVAEQLLRHARNGGPGCGELAGRRLGVIGYGSVGQGVGRIAAALGMDVLFHTPTPRLTPADGPRWAPLRTVLETADYLTFHSPAYRPVAGIDELKRVPSAAVVVLTTLGLPMAEADLIEWQRNRTGKVVLDLCAGHGLSHEAKQVPGLELHELYAARTTESVRRAEAKLLANLTAGLNPDERESR